METPNIIVGNAVLIETNASNYIPFSESTLNDPANGVKLTITDPEGTKVVDTQAMTKSSVGQYFYYWQSTPASELGVYTCLITIDGLTYDGVYINNQIFNLIASV
jgi:hypothetical protein